MDTMTRRKASNRGWEGPYRYRMESGTTHGWIVKRGRKWLHFYSVTNGRMRILLSEEDHMITERDAQVAAIQAKAKADKRRQELGV